MYPIYGSFCPAHQHRPHLCVGIEMMPPGCLSHAQAQERVEAVGFCSPLPRVILSAAPRAWRSYGGIVTRIGHHRRMCCSLHCALAFWHSSWPCGELNKIRGNVRWAMCRPVSTRNI